MDWPMEPLWSISRITFQRLMRLLRSKNHTFSGTMVPICPLKFFRFRRMVMGKSMADAEGRGEWARLFRAAVMARRTSFSSILLISSTIFSDKMGRQLEKHANVINNGAKSKLLLILFSFCLSIVPHRKFVKIIRIFNAYKPKFLAKLSTIFAIVGVFMPNLHNFQLVRLHVSTL